MSCDENSNSSKKKMYFYGPPDKIIYHLGTKDIISDGPIVIKKKKNAIMKIVMVGAGGNGGKGGIGGGGGGNPGQIMVFLTTVCDYNYKIIYGPDGQTSIDLISPDKTIKSYMVKNGLAGTDANGIEPGDSANPQKAYIYPDDGTISETYPNASIDESVKETLGTLGANGSAGYNGVNGGAGWIGTTGSGGAGANGGYGGAGGFFGGSAGGGGDGSNGGAGGGGGGGYASMLVS